MDFQQFINAKFSTKLTLILISLFVSANVLIGQTNIPTEINKGQVITRSATNGHWFRASDND